MELLASAGKDFDPRQDDGEGIRVTASPEIPMWMLKHIRGLLDDARSALELIEEEMRELDARRH